jgi:hypothetical protein
MTDRLFPILGIEAIPLVGRKKVMERIWNDLSKISPSNLSVVGPRYIGKTVLLNAVADRARQTDSPYAFVLFWELGFDPPQSDEAFLSVLCDKVSEMLSVDSTKYQEHRDYLKAEKSCKMLKEVLDALESDNEKLLMIWDGFDKPLNQGLLSGSLFGQLRDLFYGKCHRIITATRATQTELARNKQVEDSPFWNMFDVNPVRVEPFDDSDVEHALSSTALSLNQGGKKELVNWTGGHPVLLLSLLNALIRTGNGEKGNQHVNEAALTTAAELSDFLDKLWHEFSAPTKNTFHLLVESEGLDKDRIDIEVTRFLLIRGLAVREGARIKPSCRLFTKHVHGFKPDSSTLDRMFGTWDAYRTEIRTILELRIKQIRPINARLHRLVTRALDDIPDNAIDCLNNLNFIEDLALEIIWDHEFGAGKPISQEVITYWTQYPRENDFIVKEMMAADDWRRPSKPFDQLKILQRLTGCSESFDSKAKHISKDCYVLLNAIHAYRNRTVHPEGQPIHTGVAISALLLCIELLGCLERELG